MGGPSQTDALSPDDIDTLTELAAILARLRPPPGPSSLAISTPALANLTGLPGLSQLSTTGSGTTPAPLPGAVTGTTPLPSTAPNTAAAGTLTLKDIPTATDKLKHKLQTVRVQIRGFPDVGRTIAEQEEEIAELEARMGKQREVLERLREVGMQFVVEESSGGVGDRMAM
jgi:hypothetical protein